MTGRPDTASSRSHRFGALVPGAAVGLAVLALYILRLDDVAGVIGDDAWYVVLAKAIAEGHGPRMINSAGIEMLSQVYPPGFPAILSLVFLVSPEYPDNLVWLKSVSIAGMIGAGLLTFRYAHHASGLPRAQATAVAVATVITPALVFLATSTVMSEGVYLFVQLAAVLAIERAARAADDRAGRASAMLAGVLAGAAFLTRTAGLTVLVAALLYLAWRRRWRSAAACGAVAVLCVLPWSLYSRAHAPSRADLVDHGGLMAVAYTDQFWTTEAGTVTSRAAGLSMLPARVARNVSNIAIRDMGGIFVPLMFRTPGESGLEVIGLGPPEGGRVPSMGVALGTKMVSAALAFVALVGFVLTCRRGLTVAEPLVVLSLGMIVLWPFWTFRFVLPLVPFLLLYLVRGVEAIGGWAGRVIPRAPAPPALVRVFLLVLIGLNLLDHVQYVAQAYGAPRGVSWKAHADDIENVFEWIRRQPSSGGAVAADNPALVHLRTGRKTVAIHSFDDPWSRWRRMGVQYVVSLSDGAPLVDPRAVLRFKLEDRNIWAYELVPQSVASSTQSPDRSVLNRTR